MQQEKKICIFGAGGRVGLGLAQALLRQGFHVTAVDRLPTEWIGAALARTHVDARLACGENAGTFEACGGIDVLDQAAISELLMRVAPDVVVNYAIPFTWDAAKQLPNYSAISCAGLGAFAAVQVLAPKIIAQAIVASGIDTRYLVGNLPDITVPVLYGLATQLPLALPLAGAGNVGLIEAAIRYTVANERNVAASDVKVSLVAHHVHWVAPREPGYPDDAPFLLKVCVQNEDISATLGNPRALMNRAIVSCYEPGAGFSSTTSLLAAAVVNALLDNSGNVLSMHVPAPNGLPGGYPVHISNGVLTLDLPDEWTTAEAQEAMQEAHRKDGIEGIGSDGSIHFNPQSVAILKKEMGMELPLILPPADLEAVAKEQITIARQAIGSD